MGTRNTKSKSKPSSLYWWAFDANGYLASFDAGVDGPVEPGFVRRNPAERDFELGALGRRLFELPSSLVPQLDAARLFALTPEREQVRDPSAAQLRLSGPDIDALVELDSFAPLDEPELVASFRRASKRRGLIRRVCERPCACVIRASPSWLARQWTKLGVRRALVPFVCPPGELGALTLRYVPDHPDRGTHPRRFVFEPVELGPARPLLRASQVSAKLRAEAPRIGEIDLRRALVSLTNCVGPERFAMIRASGR